MSNRSRRRGECLKRSDATVYRIVDYRHLAPGNITKADAIEAIEASFRADRMDGGGRHELQVWAGRAQRAVDVLGADEAERVMKRACWLYQPDTFRKFYGDEEPTL